MQKEALICQWKQLPLWQKAVFPTGEFQAKSSFLKAHKLEEQDSKKTRRVISRRNLSDLPFWIKQKVTNHHKPVEDKPTKKQKHKPQARNAVLYIQFSCMYKENEQKTSISSVAPVFLLVTGWAEEPNYLEALAWISTAAPRHPGVMLDSAEHRHLWWRQIWLCSENQHCSIHPSVLKIFFHI